MRLQTKSPLEKYSKMISVHFSWRAHPRLSSKHKQNPEIVMKQEWQSWVHLRRKLKTISWKLKLKRCDTEKNVKQVVSSDTPQ